MPLKKAWSFIEKLIPKSDKFFKAAVNVVRDSISDRD